ncbi:MAG: hypothetical protein E7425_09410 [Ruminococcaceae bacterium]|nr:hypothetical protein [Oscillospiraceae bacterium]
MLSFPLVRFERVEHLFPVFVQRERLQLLRNRVQLTLRPRGLVPLMDRSQLVEAAACPVRVIDRALRRERPLPLRRKRVRQRAQRLGVL